ncbi:uncharacterized protein PRCAT00003777001 [Priceomyces carsonii]|uniref:uncharacterized protein n=1 Tax=Priceomyces carsonii TaxID=28549 RepID=UPI002EDA1D63|nr:unnamed protein product [Priceomyces carsonii]
MLKGLPRASFRRNLRQKWDHTEPISGSEHRRRIGSTSSSTHLGGDKFPIYTRFLEDLKNKKYTPGRNGIYNKSFAEINPSSLESISDQDRKEIAWSSQYDPVTRSPFAKDVVHLQSLLDALLASKNFERADKILRAIYPLLASSESFIFSVNKYLQAWSSEDSNSLMQVEEYVQDLKRRYGILPNDRTFAILISKCLSEDPASSSYMKYIDRHNPAMSKKIFSHIDVIGVDGLMKIFNDSAINENLVPIDLVSLFKQVRNDKKETHLDLENDETPEYFINEDSDAPTIDKDAETLKAVNSFGLKVIRHTLLGLRAESSLPLLDEFLHDLESEMKSNVLHNTSASEKKDYFAVYKSLETDDQREKFNEALDLFNEGRQRQLELRGVDGAKVKWKHEFEEMQKRGAVAYNKSLNVQLFKWYSDLLPYVEEEVKQCRSLIEGEVTLDNCKPEEKSIMKDRAYYAPYLVLVPPNKMCVLTILELLKLNSTGGIVDGMRTARAVISVGKALELEYKSQNLLKAQGKALSKKLKNTNQWKKLLRNHKGMSQEDPISNEWDYPIHAKVGSVLTSLLIHVAKVPVKGVDPTTGKTVKGMQPAFHHTYQYLQGQRLGVLKVHKYLVRQLAGNSLSNSVQPQLLPMLVPPRPWTTYNNGGYLFSLNNVVRIKDSAETTAYLRAASDAHNLDSVYAGLNVLGETSWTINRRVFEVICKYWNTGEKFLDIPPIVDEPELPEPIPFNAEPSERSEYQRKVKKAMNDAASARSQRCDTNYKLEIARAFLGEKLFFPHNVDFRGRAYPLSPHFNHLGNDMTRSLFLFWDGKELGERGLVWLKIHLANLYGIDKAPLHERLQFVDENLDNIFKSAKDPYDPSSWWLKGEKPWQTLSVCFELYEAYKLDDPTKFVSNTPIHQDGTCNGLQHYAALGGDIEGARQVNLIPADRPQDVYNFVAGLVQKRIDVEAEAGNKYAIFLKDKITRKVVKQTVMTNVYGVTFVGAVLQIQKQIAFHFGKDDSDKVADYARYLTSLVFASIRELFEGAHLIQDWLGESAKRISKSVRVDYEEKSAKNSNKPSHLSSVIWTTPLGLPCVQPYRVSKKQIISTNLQDIVISDPFGASQVDARKQQAAFPPNFVHSLDATHMLMTAKACGEKGIAFASVHDSYWTHASNVDSMNQIIREEFVRLHKDNLIVKIRDEFEKRYEGFLQVITISGESEIAAKIKDVRRNIVKDLGRALTVADEIYLEKKRQQLLASKDPEVVKMGKEMVTTISVIEDIDMNKLAVSSASSKVFQILAPLKFPDIPKRGELDVSVVNDSPYFFS